MPAPALPRRPLRATFQVLLGLTLLFAGTSHLTTARQEFRAQVPTWVPLDPDVVVVASGIVELTLGLALVLAWRYPWRALVGGVVALFFVAIFPGNISQLVTHTDAFGLDTDTARVVRLFFQPVLVLWALWSTGAWRAGRAWWRGRH
ncbi:DoxX family protein [Cellulomonas soli]|uniref:Membrane protein n=1 Tax=Cellulomonas soli TaxID=931535 RepID=A0A512PGK9_9CELL|nr:MauE/DoxX family redox-associated membrane protein [Cellulomonas soli]NYI58206.1 putative membrane protein [Cellulomonas soli]GEP70338.1 membrane protein [Cellulomonas soli]